MKTNSQEQVTGQSPLPNICSMQHPSVTTVLSPFTDFSEIRPDILAAAAARGSRVHAACAAHVNGLWADCFLLQEEKGYFKSFLDWSSRAVSEFRAVEMELADPKLGYMGHPDAHRQNVGRYRIDRNRLQNTHNRIENMAAANSGIRPPGKDQRI